MQHWEAIQKAIDYIEANLTGDVSLYQAARAACFSVPHFYRLFRVYTGHAVGAYVLRRRLSLAADALRQGRGTVADIAFSHGFESHDVFTRAFIRVYGMPPSRYRKCGGATPFGPVIAKGLPGAERLGAIRYEAIQIPGFTVAGMRCSAMEWDADGAVGRLWSDFLLRVEEIDGLAAPTVMVGLCEPGHTEPGRFSYMAAVGVIGGSKPPDGMAIRALRPQLYMQAHVPEDMSVPDAYTQTIRHAEESGYSIDEYDYIELYEEHFRDPADHRFVLLIPIR